MTTWWCLVLLSLLLDPHTLYIYSYRDLGEYSILIGCRVSLNPLCMDTY